MKNIRKITLSVFQLLIIININFAQETITDGWRAFNKNEWPIAKEIFTGLSDNDPSLAEAFLGLSLIASMEGDDESSFINFRKFFDLEENGQAYLYGLWFSNNVFGSDNRKTNSQIEFLTKLINKPDVDVTILKQAYYTLATHYYSIGDFKNSNAYFAKIGTITAWNVVGEFENISASGYNKTFEPISHPEKDYIFKNRKNADVKWFDLKNNDNGRWIMLRNNFICSNSIIYAQTFCNSPEEQDVYFRIGRAGSIKLWVNDANIWSNKEEIFGALDNDIISIHLNKGYNRILLQLGSSDIENMYFLARITDEKGNDIEGLSFTTEYQSYNKGKTISAKCMENFAETYFKSKLQKDAKDLLSKVFLSKVLLRQGKLDEAYLTLKDIMAIYPKSNYVLLHMIEVYEQKENYTEYSRLIEQIKINEPDGIITNKLLLEEELDKEEFLKAQNYAEKLQEQIGETEYVLSSLIKIAANQNKVEELVQYINKGYYKYPNNYYFVELKSLVEKELKQNPSAGISVLKKYIKTNYDYDAIDKLINSYLEIGNVKSVFPLVNKCIAIAPNMVDYYETLADIYTSMRNYTEAINILYKAVEIAPYISYLHQNLGNCYREIDKKEEAINEYKNCLKFNPNNYTTRHALRELEEKPDVFDYFTKPDYDKIYKMSPNQDAYPDQNILSLYDEVQKIVYEGGGSEELPIIMIKALKSTGIDMLKSYSIPVYSNQNFTIHKAEVMKKNGSKVKAETSGYDVVFTNLEEGDAVVLEYKIENYYQAKLLTHFWDKYYFVVDYPYLSFKYSLLVPTGTKFQYRVENMQLDPKIETKDEFTLYTWERKNVEALKEEKYMPSWEDIGATLYISSFPDWDYISSWYADISRTKAEITPEIKEVVANLLKDKPNLTDLEKAKEIYNYIITNVRYSSVSFLQSGYIPQKASNVLNTRLGDCKDVTTLFITMCKEANLDARFILVSSRNRGAKNMVLPSIDFDHAIARLDVNGKSYYIELTSDNYPFNTVDKFLEHSFILEAADNNGKTFQPIYLKSDTRLQNTVYRKTTIIFENNKIIVIKNNQKNGHAASSMRYTYKNQTKEQQKKELFESLSSDFANLKLDSFYFNETLNNPNDSITYYYSYSASNPFTKINNMNILKIPYSDMIISADFINEDRKYPIELWAEERFDKWIEVIELKIPKDKKLAEVPKNVNFKCKHAEYSLTFKLQANVLTIKREFKVLKDYVELADVKALRDFYVNVIQSDGNQIGFLDVK